MVVGRSDEALPVVPARPRQLRTRGWDGVGVRWPQRGGKSTTLKALFNVVHADGGVVRFLGMEFASNEAEIKHLAGQTFGGVDQLSAQEDLGRHRRQQAILQGLGRGRPRQLILPNGWIAQGDGWHRGGLIASPTMI